MSNTGETGPPPAAIDEVSHEDVLLEDPQGEQAHSITQSSFTLAESESEP